MQACTLVRADYNLVRNYFINQSLTFYTSLHGCVIRLKASAFGYTNQCLQNNGMFIVYQYSVSITTTERMHLLSLTVI